MSVKVYVLLMTSPKQTMQVFDQVSKSPSVTECHQVMGPYDIMVEIKTPGMADIATVLTDEIRTIKGIQSLSSLVVI